MKRGFSICAIYVAAGILWAGAVRADEMAAKIREVANRHQASLAILKGVVEISFSMGGKSQDQEAPVEFPAFAVDGGGLYVTLNPENPATYQGGMAQMPGVRIDVKGKEYKIQFPDGKESAARIEGVDPEYGLAFVRLEEAASDGPAVKSAAKDSLMGKSLSMGDPFVVLRLLSSNRPEVVAEMGRVDAALEKPSRMFRFADGGLPTGSPVFDLEGNLVGLTCVYRETLPSSNAAAHRVILPAARLAEMAAKIKLAGETK